MRILITATLVVAALTGGTVPAAAADRPSAPGVGVGVGSVQYSERGVAGFDHPTVTVVSTGFFPGLPEAAYLSADIEVTKPTATFAADSVELASRDLLKAFKENDVPQDDVQPTAMKLSPVIFRDGSGGSRVVSYQADKTFSVVIRRGVLAAHIVEAVSQAVGDAVRLGPITYGSADPDDLRGLARDRAFGYALEAAKQYAGFSRYQLGHVLTMQEVGQGSALTPPGAPGPTASMGESVTVTVVWELK